MEQKETAPTAEPELLREEIIRLDLAYDDIVRNVPEHLREELDRYWNRYLVAPGSAETWFKISLIQAYKLGLTDGGLVSAE